METEFHMAPELTPLSNDEVDVVLRAAKSLDLPSSYVKSGCHDRAHLMWMSLPPDLRAKMGKVWILSPRVLTLAITTPITMKNATGSPNWGYHVALVYRSSRGVQVLDTTVPDSLAGQYAAKRWLDGFVIPPGSLTVLLAPELYLFFSNKVPPELFDAKSKGNEVKFYSNTKLRALVNTGQFFTYEGASRDSMYIENAVARDEVGAALLKEGHGCAWAEIEEPDDLLATLQSRANAPSNCRDFAVLFQNRVEHWREAVAAWSSG